MSQTRKTLKNIASGEHYRNLVAAIEKVDYAGILSGYTEISKLVEEADKEIVQKIQSLPRLNKDEESQKFRSAFAQRARATLPQWYWLNSELQKQKIMDGVVFGFGSKGDPLVRTPEGRVVVLSGAKLKEGDKAKFKVYSEGEKLDFGRLFELTPDAFYFILSQDTRQKIRDSLASIRERINALPRDADKDSFSNVSGLLKELEDVRELASKLREDEKERIVAQVLAYRRRLLESSIVKLIFDFISREEEREISESCRDESLLSASAVAGLFRREVYEALKARLFAGGELKGYSEAVETLENKLDSMDSAVQLLDFKASIDKISPMAKRYLERMDRLFERLSNRARECALRLAEDTAYDAQHVHSIVMKDFSVQALCSELRRVFHSPEEFFDLREALLELMSRLGDAGSQQAEVALRPYLRHRIELAFGKRAELPA